MALDGDPERFSAQSLIAIGSVIFMLFIGILMYCFLFIPDNDSEVHQNHGGSTAHYCVLPPKRRLRTRAKRVRRLHSGNNGT
mgnify:CR=1